jgi:hypothetical protein
MAWLNKQAEKADISKLKPGLGSWEQVESAVREMAELQLSINRERDILHRTIETARASAVTKARPLLFRQADLEAAIGDFIRKIRRSCRRIERSFDFGHLVYHKQRLDISLDVASAARRLGLP